MYILARIKFQNFENIIDDTVMPKDETDADLPESEEEVLSFISCFIACQER